MYLLILARLSVTAECKRAEKEGSTYIFIKYNTPFPYTYGES